MTVQELYDHITKFMTPEEALKKLLETSVEQYTQLRTLERHAGSPLMIVVAAAAEMGWNLEIENAEISNVVRGIKAGTEEYLNARKS